MTWHTIDELNQLEKTLEDLGEENDPMLLTEFDGFCAGLIVCPEIISPAVWLQEVWRPVAPLNTENLSWTHKTHDIILAHYNRVATFLAKHGEYFPVLAEDSGTGDIAWEFWMMGFLSAVRLQPAAWFEIEQSDDTMAVLAYKTINELGHVALTLVDGDRSNAGNLANEVPDLIPMLVRDLSHLTKSRAADGLTGFTFVANLNSGPILNSKVGRNDACKCGSGKKFKKCCGSGEMPIH
jgi:uncharacterized protein